MPYFCFFWLTCLHMFFTATTFLIMTKRGRTISILIRKQVSNNPSCLQLQTLILTQSHALIFISSDYFWLWYSFNTIFFQTYIILWSKFWSIWLTLINHFMNVCLHYNTSYSSVLSLRFRLISTLLILVSCSESKDQVLDSGGASHDNWYHAQNQKTKS